MTGDKFTRDKLAWLDHLAEDRSISAPAFRLAYVIASRFLNRTTGEAWPAQETLAKVLGLKVRQVGNLVGELVKAGHLRAKRGGRGRTNIYQIRFDDRQDVADQHVDDQQEIADQEATLTGNSARFDPQFSDSLTGKILPPNPIEEPLEEPTEGGRPYGRSAQQGSAPHSTFESKRFCQSPPEVRDIMAGPLDAAGQSNAYSAAKMRR
ncbi:MAG: helix-turn-helix domain-containing protein [Rhizobiaceae bacterium]|nr:helix-turn-helix domain-containing protein [Rhizobiaceae bacterium]